MPYPNAGDHRHHLHSANVGTHRRSQEDVHVQRAQVGMVAASVIVSNAQETVECEYPEKNAGIELAPGTPKNNLTVATFLKYF